MSLLSKRGMQIFTDGAKSKNHVGIGVVWKKNDKIIKEYSEKLPLHLTNNDAEYLALIRALEITIKDNICEKDESVSIFADSKLVVCQVNGQWKINFKHLKIHHSRVKELQKQLPFILTHIPREMNTDADRCSKKF